jgi:transposase
MNRGDLHATIVLGKDSRSKEVTMGFYCGIDLHSKRSQVCVINEDAERVLERRRVPNRIEEVLEFLDPFRDGLRVVVESTFNWYWLVDGLEDAGCDVTLAHTLGMFAITRAKVKTDRRDAFRLARLLRAGEIHPAYIYPRETRPVRDLVRQRTRVVSFRSREYATIRMRLYQHGIIDHSRRSASTLGDEELAAFFDHPATRDLVLQERQRIRLYDAQIAELDARIVEYTGIYPDYKRLLGVPGLGNTLAAVIFFETADIKRFASHKHYSSYCRLVPGTCDSEGSSRRGRGSKQGNPHLKSAYTQAAQHAQRFYPTIRRCYDRQVARHPGRGSKLIATNIIGHKLAIAVFNILDKGVDYREHLIFGK